MHDKLSIRAYHIVLSFLKDYVVELCRCDFELAHLFGTKKFLAKIYFKLLEEEILDEGPIDESVLGFIYMQKKTNYKDFLRVLDKHLVPSKALWMFINHAAKSDAPEHVKNKFIIQLKWYLEVRDWLYMSYVFIKEEAN